jgi:signal transduction histidine kinase
VRATAQVGRRLIVATVFAFAVGLVLILGVARNVARALTADRVAEVLADAVPAAALDQCRRGAPRAARIEAGAEYDFYDASGAPLHGDARPLEASLARRARGALRSAGDFDARERESRAVIRLRDAGACAFAQARWRYDGRSVAPFLTAVTASAAGVALLLAVLVALFVARPLLSRIRELHRAARLVGREGFRPAEEWSDEAGEISRALNAAHARIAQVTGELADRSASLEWVLAEVGHDVRTPLSSLQLALDELADQLPDTALATLRRALNDVIYLRSLTSNLRLASGLRGGLLPPAGGDTVCLSEIAQRAVDRSAPFALRRGIDLASVIAPDLHVAGDETGSEQALTNLLENSIAHSAPGTNVAVSVTCEGEQVRMVIEDNGPGVVPEELPRLGSKSFRAERERARDGRGTGLGLMITRAICERSGWTVRFEPAQPSGLRAVIEARRAAPRSPRPHDPSLSASSTEAVVKTRLRS